MAKNLKVIVDADDVLLSCNSYALDMLERDAGERYPITDITGWGLLGKGVDKRLRYYGDKGFFETQPALPGAGEFLRALQEKADVTIMTAVNPKFIGERITRLSQVFPDFPINHIMIGERKEMVNADIILDDRIHNILTTGCRLPVLFRQPWNRKVSGLCAVNNYHDFLTIVDYMSGNHVEEPKKPKIICLVGPGGSGKHEVANELVGKYPEKFERVYPFATERNLIDGTFINDEDDFESLIRANEFLETTFYDDRCYGTKKADYEAILSKGKSPVVIMDISGCISVKRAYPGQVKICFTRRRKRECILSILKKKKLSDTQIADRITAIDFEEKNAVLADHILDLDADTVPRAAEKVLDLARGGA